MTDMIPTEKLTRKDFTSDQDVRWCPGCGDYAILAGVQRTLPQLGVRPENTVFVSGIGCAARFPYYMQTYGFHTIHGRAPSLATGLKLARPELDVWVVTGDGDGLSIGGNHLMHVLRRNPDLQILLFNNQVYGLTKGQYSPTSPVGQVSPSTPLGSVDAPVLPVTFALGSGARFVARCYDTSKHLADMLRRSWEHKGAAFLEILQNCPVFNAGAYDAVTDRRVADEQQLWVEHGKPLLFGKNRTRGIRIRPGTLDLETVTVGEDGVTEADVLVHDQTNRTLAFLLGQMTHPVAFGVLYDDPAPTYEAAVRAQTAEAVGQKGKGDIQALLRSGHTWTVRGGDAE
jgi:2-oxoglutarate ferredoxin oxidoreductase subunit beta